MIIVSQDKEEVFNFDNVISVFINKEPFEEIYYIFAQTNTYQTSLGEYKTKERAKEILREIIELYKQHEFYKEIPLGNGVYSTKELNYVVPKIYEMPEE